MEIQVKVQKEKEEEDRKKSNQEKRFFNYSGRKGKREFYIFKLPESVRFQVTPDNQHSFVRLIIKQFNMILDPFSAFLSLVCISFLFNYTGYIDVDIDVDALIT